MQNKIMRHLFILPVQVHNIWKLLVQFILFLKFTFFLNNFCASSGKKKINRKSKHFIFKFGGVDEVLKTTARCLLHTFVDFF